MGRRHARAGCVVVEVDVRRGGGVVGARSVDKGGQDLDSGKRAGRDEDRNQQGGDAFGRGDYIELQRILPACPLAGNDLQGDCTIAVGKGTGKRKLRSPGAGRVRIIQDREVHDHAGHRFPLSAQ